MERMDPEIAAHRIVAAQFPRALAAFLCGSVLTVHRTKHSDLDLVVVLDDDATAYRETQYVHGWRTELFVHNRTSFAHYCDLDIQARRPALVRMCAEGRILTDVDGLATQLQRHASAQLHAGPAAMTPDQMLYRRYILTDLLEDYLGSREPIEDTFIAAALLQATAELSLAVSGNWFGTGKWLARGVAATDPALASALRAGGDAALAHGNIKEALIAAVRRVLDSAGGPLSDGYRSVATTTHDQSIAPGQKT